MFEIIFSISSTFKAFNKYSCKSLSKPEFLTSSFINFTYLLAVTFPLLYLSDKFNIFEYACFTSSEPLFKASINLVCKLATNLLISTLPFSSVNFSAYL